MCDMVGVWQMCASVWVFHLAEEREMLRRCRSVSAVSFTWLSCVVLNGSLPRVAKEGDVRPRAETRLAEVGSRTSLYVARGSRMNGSTVVGCLSWR